MDPWLEHFARAAFERSADTAHDLKTPLNVAVLNLELLRMRVRKLADGAEDEKIAAYAKSIELELRRMGRIFDTYFLLAAPPKNEGPPAPVDVAALAVEAGAAQGFVFEAKGPSFVIAHETRIRQAFRLFFEGAVKVFDPTHRHASMSHDDAKFRIVIEGKPGEGDSELGKAFKFYYTDLSGIPDLSLASARLVIETYGGDVIASEESDKVALILSLPLGER